MNEICRMLISYGQLSGIYKEFACVHVFVFVINSQFTLLITFRCVFVISTSLTDVTDD